MNVNFVLIKNDFVLAYYHALIIGVLTIVLYKIISTSFNH